MIEAYDVWKEKKLYGKVSMGTVRATYIMDENGVIEAAMPKVKTDTNASEILAYLEKKNAARHSNKVSSSRKRERQFYHDTLV